MLTTEFGFRFQDFVLKLTKLLLFLTQYPPSTSTNQTFPVFTIKQRATRILLVAVRLCRKLATFYSYAIIDFCINIVLLELKKISAYIFGRKEG